VTASTPYSQQQWQWVCTGSTSNALRRAHCQWDADAGQINPAMPHSMHVQHTFSLNHDKGCAREQLLSCLGLHGAACISYISPRLMLRCCMGSEMSLTLAHVNKCWAVV
jgi:hypothetical protein